MLLGMRAVEAQCTNVCFSMKGPWLQDRLKIESTIAIDRAM